MAIPILVLGQSGSGKTYSLKNLNPKTTFLIQAINKTLPFKSADWPVFASGKGGTVYTTTSHKNNPYPQVTKMLKAVSKKRKVIILDDFQYLMSNEFMRRSSEKGYDKFTEIGKNVWLLVMCILNDLPADVRVYILSHTDNDDNGREKAKTIGKLLDEKITVEGLFTIVLKTVVESGNYRFSTQNNGSDTVKTPAEMFEGSLIDNDLLKVDDAICDFYGIQRQPTKEESK